MNKRLTGLFIATAALVGCGNNQGGNKEVRANSDDKVPDSQPAPLDPNRPCLRELFNNEFCLGGPIERFAERRTVALVAEFDEKGYRVFRYARQLPMAISEETLARVDRNGVMRISREWKGPREVIRRLWSELTSVWTDDLGMGHTTGRNGRTYYRWTAAKYNVVVALDNGQSQPFGMDALLVEVVGRSAEDEAQDAHKAQLVIEAMDYAQIGKAAIEEFSKNKGGWAPFDNAEAGFNPPKEFGASAVKSLNIEGGQVYLEFDPDRIGPESALQLIPEFTQSGISWICRGVAMRPEWLPPECQLQR